MRLAKNLRLMRKRRGMTQEELAARSGLSPRHIQKLEAGEVNVTLRTVALLANALQVDLQKLFSTAASKDFRGPANGN